MNTKKIFSNEKTDLDRSLHEAEDGEPARCPSSDDA